MASKVMISVDTETFSESAYPCIVVCKKCGGHLKKIRKYPAMNFAKQSHIEFEKKNVSLRFKSNTLSKI